MGGSNNSQPKIVDLSHTIEDGMITYQGLPASKISEFLSREASRDSYANNTEFHIGKIEMVANTGTYLDSPFHRYVHGKDLAQISIQSLVNLDGTIIHCPVSQGRKIDKESFLGRNIQQKAVLIHTGWDHNWRTDRYFNGHPYLTREAAAYLKDSAVSLVGIDSLNVDDTKDGSRPAHTILLGANIPIIEHMTNLNQLPEVGFKLFAVPPKIIGLGSFPVRVFAIIHQSEFEE